MHITLVDYLEKYNIPYIKRDIKKYGDSGSRVSIPKDWEGSVIVVHEKLNQTKILNNLTDELIENMNNCNKMRGIVTESPDLPCASIDDEIFKDTGRDNDVCRRCPFGNKIEELTRTVNAIYDSREKDEIVKQKLAEQYFEEKEG